MVKIDNKDETSKQRILNAATKLFATKGFDGTSIREICKEADANICMISYYWGGKRELYQGILDSLIEQQTQYAKTFMNISENPKDLTKREQVNLLFLIFDKAVDFLYSNISQELIIILLKEQQSKNFILSSPMLDYLRKLIAAIFEKDENEKEIIFKTIFIISQINSPRILTAFSLGKLGQSSFTKEDTDIIKSNVKLYIQALLKESEIEY